MPAAKTNRSIWAIVKKWANDPEREAIRVPVCRLPRSNGVDLRAVAVLHGEPELSFHAFDQEFVTVYRIARRKCQTAAR